MAILNKSTPTVPFTSDPATFTNQMWAELVLTFLGAPITQNNVDNFTSWMQSENGSGSWVGTAGANNPLNNGLGSGGGSGLGSYPDLIVAAAYAAKGLEGGITGAGPIGDALKADAPFSVFHSATLAADWSGNHYAGTYWAGETSPHPAPTVSAADAAKAAGKGGQIQTANTLSILKSLNLTLPTDIGQAIPVGPLPIQPVGNFNPPNPLSWADALGHILNDLLSADWWTRLGIFTLGVVFIGGGIVLFVSTTKTGQKVESDAAVAAIAA